MGKVRYSSYQDAIHDMLDMAMREPGMTMIAPQKVFRNAAEPELVNAENAFPTAIYMLRKAREENRRQRDEIARMRREHREEVARLKARCKELHRRAEDAEIELEKYEE